METQMEAALKKAGVPILPIRQRIWQFVKDNPSCTSNTIINKVSGATQKHVSDVKACGLISVTYDRRRDKVGRMRNISLFTASDIYDETSRPKPCKTKEKPELKVEAEPTMQVKLPQNTYKFDLDSLTIAEAKQLYAKLKRMFA